MYQVLVKIRESRNSDVLGPLSFPNKEDRETYVKGPEVFWYHYVEEDDWFDWRRGGAWQATKPPDPPAWEPPEGEEKDRW